LQDWAVMKIIFPSYIIQKHLRSMWSVWAPIFLPKSQNSFKPCGWSFEFSYLFGQWMPGWPDYLDKKGPIFL